MIASRGFSLVELMVAMTIGSVVSAAAFTAIAHARASWAAAEQQNRLHERAQYVFATLETELQMAGYFGGHAPTPLPPSSVPGAATACGVAVIARLDRGVESSRARYSHPCAPQGGGYLQGTDVLLVRRISAHESAAGNGRLSWLACLTPGCVPRLLAAPITQAPPAFQRDLVIRIFYVARAADADTATPSLRVKSLSAIAGAPAFIDTEVMPGVNDLQIQIQPDAEHPRSVQVTIGVQTDAGDKRAGEALRRLTLTRQFAVRNAFASL